MPRIANWLSNAGTDSMLLRQDGILIQDRIVGSESGRCLDGAPYVVLIADGRHAYRYADDEGRTRPVHVEKPVPYEVFWYDDAWKQRDAPADVARPDSRSLVRSH